MKIFDNLYLVTNHDGGLLPVVSLQESLREAPSTVRAPDRLLGVVGLGHGLSLHLHGDHEVGAGVGVLPPSTSELDVSGHLNVRRETEETWEVRDEIISDQNQEKCSLSVKRGWALTRRDREICPQQGERRD